MLNNVVLQVFNEDLMCIEDLLKSFSVIHVIFYICNFYNIVIEF